MTSQWHEIKCNLRKTNDEVRCRSFVKTEMMYLTFIEYKKCSFTRKHIRHFYSVLHLNFLYVVVVLAWHIIKALVLLPHSIVAQDDHLSHYSSFMLCLWSSCFSYKTSHWKQFLWVYMYEKAVSTQAVVWMNVCLKYPWKYQTCMRKMIQSHSEGIFVKHLHWFQCGWVPYKSTGVTEMKSLWTGFVWCPVVLWVHNETPDVTPVLPFIWNVFEKCYLLLLMYYHL